MVSSLMIRSRKLQMKPFKLLDDSCLKILTRRVRIMSIQTLIIFSEMYKCNVSVWVWSEFLLGLE